ncbi:DUF317 domain-containing protein [Streptomyces orinoci]|uniref:DUF317 domain-containing protein n=1 Tax=Streptomyces orinoci TaxID=67339 RepID=A0ABV3JUT9_STRON|nr:DUF317 domain-containing protein [Streptomyces orinoci]
MRHRYATTGTDTPTWTAWAGYPSEPHWRAHFSFGAPATLVAAFTASLISTEPVRRTVADVPFHTRRHLYLATATAAHRTSASSPAAAPPAGPAPGRTG